MNKINDSTPLVHVTLGQFWEQYELRYGVRPHPSQDNEQQPTGRLVYGLRGIQDLFHCSHKQAQHYKDNIIHEAVRQNGRKIVVDADKALELFNQRKAK